MVAFGYYDDHALTCARKQDAIGIDLVDLVCLFVYFLPVVTSSELMVLP